MGPLVLVNFIIPGRICPPSGPGGIRTRDLFSAIEARSQLRYRPLFTSTPILIEVGCGVKEAPDFVDAPLTDVV